MAANQVNGSQSKSNEIAELELYDSDDYADDNFDISNKFGGIIYHDVISHNGCKNGQKQGFGSSTETFFRYKTSDGFNIVSQDKKSIPFLDMNIIEVPNIMCACIQPTKFQRIIVTEDRSIISETSPFQPYTWIECKTRTLFTCGTYEDWNKDLNKIPFMSLMSDYGIFDGAFLKILFAQMTELKNNLNKAQLKYYNILKNINDKNAFETTIIEHC